ncbi:MAG: FAD-binding oxidoreductase [Oligoflexia bacterium]|nr:FAD-binding oxidoreductase [Oligoflexia bacterium]
MSLPPWLDDPPAPLFAQDALPAAVDVVVIGGGLGGLSAAGALAGGGARVAVLEARAQLGGGISTRAPGLVISSLGEHPGRLVNSVGRGGAREMHTFLKENRELLIKLGLFQRTGSLSVGAMDREGQEIADTLDVLPDLGVPSQACSAAAVAERLHSAHFDNGRLVKEDGLVDPVALASRLVGDARQAGATLHPAHPVTSLVEQADGWHACGDTFDLRADAIVLAAGHGLKSLVPWFQRTVYPVRQQWIATAPVKGTRLPLPVLGQHGFCQWMQCGDRVVAGGARFGTADMEVGQTDDTVIQPDIDHILRQNLARFFPDLAGLPVARAWTAIATFSCDGLPLIGPIPGQIRLVACTGFHGLGHRLALRAGHAVAQGLLFGKASGVPSLFRPGRLV